MLTRDDVTGFVIFSIITSDASVYRFFYNWNLVLIRARDTRFLASSVDAHSRVLNIIILMKISDVHFPDIKRTWSITSFTIDGPKA